MNIRKFKSDVRGAALVYVIVAAAIIILLGAATTATAYVNLRTTQIQEHADNNFYNADAIMNAIRSGLESDMSRAYETAYVEVVTKLDTYASPEAAREDFNTIFLNTLNSALNDGNESFEFFYSAAHIQRYVEDVFGDNVSYTITALHGNNYIDLLDNGIILRNLHVTYEDDTGYFDEINTDVKLMLPEFDPDMGTTEVEISGVVIDEGLEIDTNKGLSIDGDVFINERDADRSAVLLKMGSGLTITSPYEVILGGLIKTEGTNDFYIKASDDTQRPYVWTENFDFGRGNVVDMTGTLCVMDDLEVNGSNTSVKLTGQYFGYSKNNVDADWSSSININGAHTKLDIELLDDLVLAGTSYISTSNVPSEKEDNDTDIQLGEGFSVKSNQIAYLVDDKEFSSNDIEKFYSNPMSYKQYDKMLEANGGLGMVISKLISKPLSYEGSPTYAELGATVQPIFSSHDGGTVYLYLSFNDPAEAAAYFEMAYKGNTLLSQRLRTYAGEYIANMILNPNTEVTVNQNYINTTVSLYDPEVLRLTMEGFGYNKDHAPSTEEDKVFVEKAMQSYRDGYGYSDDRATATSAKYKKSFDRMINEEKFVKFIENASSSDENTNNKIERIENGVIISGTASDTKAILINNKGKDAYVLEGGKGMLIASGDVIIKGNWTGTLIIGGRLTCTEGSKIDPVVITYDENISSSVTPLYFTKTVNGTTEAMQVLNVFKGCETLEPNYATDDEGIDSDMISKCVIFSNWNRY